MGTCHVIEQILWNVQWLNSNEGRDIEAMSISMISKSFWHCSDVKHKVSFYVETISKRHRNYQIGADTTSFRSRVPHWVVAIASLSLFPIAIDMAAYISIAIDIASLLLLHRYCCWLSRLLLLHRCRSFLSGFLSDSQQLLLALPMQQQ